MPRPPSTAPSHDAPDTMTAASSLPLSPSSLPPSLSSSASLALSLASPSSPTPSFQSPSSTESPSTSSPTSSPTASPTASPPSPTPTPTSAVPASRPWTAWRHRPPLFASHRQHLILYTHPRFLTALFSLQLALHCVYVATAVAVLARPGLLTGLLGGHGTGAAFGSLRWLPVFLVVRAAVCVPLTVRRVWLLKTWESTWWESAVCVAVLAASGAMGLAGLVAVCELPASSLWMYSAAWLLVGSMLLLVVAQAATYLVLLLLFRRDALTISMPVLPLAAHWYFTAQPAAATATTSHGLTTAQLRTLPLSVYEGDRDEPVCAVCMDDVAVGDVQRVLRCGHGYHQPCIDPWLLKRKVCPLCVRAVRPSLSRPSMSECVVELAERVKPQRSEEVQDQTLMV